MLVFLSHTDIDSGGDPSNINRVIDTTDPSLDPLITQVITAGYCEWDCDDQEYFDFRDALKALPKATLPITIDKFIVDSTQSW